MGEGSRMESRDPSETHVTGSTQSVPGRAAGGQGSEKATRKSRVLIALSGAIVAAAAAGLAWYSLTRSQGNSGPAESRSALVLDWHVAQRADGGVDLDGRLLAVPAEGPVQYPVNPGKHKVRLIREGYQAIDLEIALDDDARYVYKPEWTPTTDSPKNLRLSPTLDGWLQDVEAAKKKAIAEGKDLLLVFRGSDGVSAKLSFEILLQTQFGERLQPRFVFVLVDFPRDAESRAKVQNPGRNAQLRKQYRVTRLPRVVLADRKGDPFTLIDYTAGGLATFLSQVDRAQVARSDRDRLFGEIETGSSEARLAAIRQALALLQELKLIPFYGLTIERWLAVAEKYDPANEHGVNELMFETTWGLRLAKINFDRPDPEEINRLVDQLHDWKKSHPIKDRNRAASMHKYAAAALLANRRPWEALREVEAGLACQPSDPLLPEELKSLAATIRGVGTGTAFVVAPGGIAITNYHVVEGPARLLVKLPGRAEPVPAEILASDPLRDVALLKVAVPPGVNLLPIPLSREPARRGSRVLAIGFPPIGPGGGPGLKLTQGIVSATPKESPDGMFVLDCRVNPGNSGGPLCDVNGNAVGMVTAKTVGGSGVESYGMAIPAEVLRQFLAKHGPADQHPAAPRKADKVLEWDEVDRLTTPSVLMVSRVSLPSKE